jgi:hypothetical protein
MTPEILIPVIVCLVVVGGYCVYQIKINPFGWTSRCRRERTIRFADGSTVELVRPNQYMLIPMIEDFVRGFGRRICNKETIDKIMAEKATEQARGALDRRFNRKVRVIAKDDFNTVWILLIDGNGAPFAFLEQENETYHDCLIAISRTVVQPSLPTKVAVA